jgi:hypothetical protein
MGGRLALNAALTYQPPVGGAGSVVQTVLQMIRALLLVLDAGASWEKIARAQRGFVFIVLVHLAPLMVITIGLEAYFMTRLGAGRTITGDLIAISQQAALRYGVAALILSLGVILIVAKLLERISRSFHNVTSFSACFTLVAYGISPLFLLHLLDALPGVNTWVCFAIGFALSVAALYLGVPTVLKPDPAKAMGLYFVVSVVLLVLAGLAHFVAQTILLDRLNPRFWEQFIR